MIFCTIHGDGFVDHLLFFCHHRDLPGIKPRFSHIDLYERHFIVLSYGQIQRFDAASRGHCDLQLIHNAVIIGIFCHTADTVAAHSAPGAVSIVHIHLTIRHFRRLDQNQSVRTDTEVTVADPYGRAVWILYLFFKAIDIHIVIADTLHFCKLHYYASCMIRISICAVSTMELPLSILLFCT